MKGRRFTVSRGTKTVPVMLNRALDSFCGARGGRWHLYFTIYNTFDMGVHSRVVAYHILEDSSDQSPAHKEN